MTTTGSEGGNAALGRALAAAYLRRSPTGDDWIDKIATLDDAYEVQDALVAALIAAGGGLPAGYKVGLTTPAMQRFCGVDQPICGRILAGDIRADGARLRRGALLRLGIESELAVRLAVDLDPARLDDATLLGAIGSVHAAFEIIDDRDADYAALTARRIVAENSWNAGIVAGPGVAVSTLGTLDARAGFLEQDGVAIGNGSSSDVLDGPLSVMRWLSLFLAGRGSGLRAGDWIMTGAIVTTKFPMAGAHLRFTLDGLPPVSVETID